MLAKIGWIAGWWFSGTDVLLRVEYITKFKDSAMHQFNVTFTMLIRTIKMLGSRLSRWYYNNPYCLLLWGLFGVLLLEAFQCDWRNVLKDWQCQSKYMQTCINKNPDNNSWEKHISTMLYKWESWVFVINSKNIFRRTCRRRWTFKINAKTFKSLCSFYKSWCFGLICWCFTFAQIWHCLIIKWHPQQGKVGSLNGRNKQVDWCLMTNCTMLSIKSIWFNEGQ